MNITRHTAGTAVSHSHSRCSSVKVVCRGADRFSSSSDSGLLLDGRSSLVPPREQPSRGGRGGSQPSLILPGSMRPPGNPNARPIIPGSPSAPSQRRKLQIDEDDALGMEGPSAPVLGIQNAVATINKFRPPPGFMDDALPHSLGENLSAEEMLAKLRAQAGAWHQLAKLLPLLSSKGWDASAIELETGIPPSQQNLWLVASTVYDSLVSSDMPQSVLSVLGASGGESLLHPFRFLNNEARVNAAQYLVDNNYGSQMCEVLARSMKEWERRPMEREGFAFIPGDCLAFKYLRDAGECRRKEESVARLEQALAVAVTPEARERVLEALVELSGEAATQAEETAAGLPAGEMLITLRLDPDELGTRPVPVLGELGRVTLPQVSRAPRAVQEGAFGMFSMSGDVGAHWVALPQWKALAMARQPVALQVHDCSGVEPIVQAARAKTDDDKRRLQGVGLLVADRSPDTVAEALQMLAGRGHEASPDALTLPPGTATMPYGALPASATPVSGVVGLAGVGSWYLVEGGPGQGVVLGSAAQALRAPSRVCGVVLFLARPPNRDTPVQGTDMLQV